jgi:hypothetical protein
MTRLETIQTRFAGIYGGISIYIDGTQFFFIDVDGNRLEGYKTVTASCGCCSEIEDIDTDLSYELEWMADEDFADLLIELENLK